MFVQASLYSCNALVMRPYKPVGCVCVGVAPPSFLFIQAGQTLNKLTSSTDALSWTSVLFLMIFAIMALVPVIYKKRLQAKFEETKEK